MTPKSVTPIIISHPQEIPAALSYRQSHPHEPVILVACSLAVILELDKQYLKYFSLSKLLDSPLPNAGLHHLPYQLTRKYLATLRPQLKLGSLDLTIPLTEMLRFELPFMLDRQHLLSQLYYRHPFKKLIATSEFFSTLDLQLFCNTFKIKLHFLETPSRAKFTPFVARINRHLLFLRHFRLTLKALFHPLRIFSKTVLDKNSILVFSNGLNLASYHSVFRSLSRHLPTYLVTGKQTLLDRFFLIQYHLDTWQLPPRPIYQFRISKFTSQLQRHLRHFQFTPSSQLLSQFNLPIAPQIVGQILASQTKLILSRWLPKFLYHYLAAQSAIRQLKPKLVITTHDPGPTGVAFTLAAQAAHIPTLVLIHGSPSEVHFFFADKQIIWGPLMKRYLTHFGLAPSRLILGGHPIYFNYQQFFKHVPKSSPHCLTIGIITSGFGPHEVNQTQFFLKVFPQLAKLKSSPQLLVRSHATQQLDASLPALARRYRLNLTVNPPLLLEEFVAQCDLIITQDSTAALVPLIAGKPTIALPAWMPFFDRGLVLNSEAFFHLKPNQNLTTLINHILNSPQARSLNRRHQLEFLRQYCGLIDAKIGTRITQKILQHLS